ncbi:collagen-like triple helix repeat-containing protein [Spirosoma arcticum]
MKTRFSLFLHIGTGFVALLFMVVSSCKGPEGPAGPQGTPGLAGTTGPTGVSGATGATGPAGVSGVAGAMGNANVVYTAWKAVDLSGNYYRYPTNLELDLGNDQKTANALLTTDVMNKSLVYVYFKFGQALYDNASGAFSLVERIQASNAYGQVKIPGRTTSTYEDFAGYSVSHDYLGVNYLRFNLRLYTQQYDQAQNKMIPVAELVGKDAQFFRDMVKDLPQYRIVVVNGSTPGGRAAAINCSDYAAVKRAYKLPD